MLEFPRWKYIVIVLVVALSVLYALPNLYPKDPSVQVTANRGSVLDESVVSRVKDSLKSEGIAWKAVDLEDKSVLVRLPNPDLQTRAADHLRTALGDGYPVALNLAPTVPAWMEKLYARPMSLGLDLQGGVHFVMKVDQKAALDKRIDNYVDNIRTNLREQHVRYTAVNRQADNSILINLPKADEIEKAQEVLGKTLTITNSSGITTAGLAAGFRFEPAGNTVRVVLPESELQNISASAIQQNRDVIANRINSLGVAEPLLQQQGNDRLVVELPGLQDTAEAKRLIGATATLEFRAVTGDESAAAAALADGNIPADSRIYYNDNKVPLLLSKRVLVSGDQLVNATPQMDQRTGSPSVSITLNSAGGQRMLDHTLENVGKRLGIVYIERIPTVSIDANGQEVRSARIDERWISASTIQGVFGKDFQTTGLSQEEAQSLAKQLKAGALAAPMDFIEERVVGPSLGAENVARGTQAVVYSFLFALAFFMIYYRVFGLITCVALLLNLVMVVAVMSVFGATMTLPGFAGLALSIGMSVDANVLINERIREELRAGVPPQTAIATGYDKASGTIFDSNMTALLAGVALYAFGTGPLKGFAITMVVGILTSVFTAVTVSRALATLIYGGRRKLKSLAI
ncbi:protein translocase subunit SecD [Pseudoxanthomonas indica]|uniref:Protein translocase subunit SecD n=1 Tax=Pseudoxanthomonas indica TaxID=428993 RepID=A0A1T5JA31_9GAMM|nr:protein translocase subunit SecD [Pseudoxanthomonas indica]GGD57565.1 protein translocase subunit SecD [Pseudoxanthomonas indica]SKC48249.1 preprotein translocase subunit SecD [Pseudoxanthomonas indica]